MGRPAYTLRGDPRLVISNLASGKTKIMSSQLEPTGSYEVKPSIAGTSVKYDCVHCGTRLTSSLMDAGKAEACPECGQSLTVPGEKEKVAEAKKQIAEQKSREEQG